jgi:DNA mismatch repair protein MutS
MTDQTSSEKIKELNKIIEDNLSQLTNLDIETISSDIILKKDWQHNSKYSPTVLQSNKIDVNNNLFQDLEIFISYTHDQNDTVYKQINFTKTHLGNHYLKEIISNPTKDVQILLNRQKLVKSLLDNPDKHAKIKSLLEVLNKCQNNGLWIWKEQTQEFKQIFQMLYFTNPYLQTFNTSEWFLKIYNYFQIIFIPLYGLIAPIIFFVIPYLIIRFFFGVNIPIKLYFNLIKQTFFGNNITSALFGKSKLVNLMQYAYQALTFFLYAYGIYNSFRAAANLNKIINMIHEKINNLAKFIKTSYELYQEVKPLFELEPLTVSYLELWDNLFEKEPYILSDKGKILRTFFLINSKTSPGGSSSGKDKLTPLLQMVGFIDAINSISHLHLAHPNSYSFPVYLTTSQGPALTCASVWNPFLNPSKAVTNDFQMGDSKPNNILITGPNASGKSTFIKSVVLGVLMAQTISMVPSQEMKITPFQLLNTYLNIPDVKGRESLFEAEMNRAREHINMINKLLPDQFSLVVMDEIFNSTNYEEGVAGAYIIGKELGTIHNSLTLITTHFSYLTKLSKTNNYLNYMFEVEKIDNRIVKSYKVKEGISKQYLALDMLEKNGYKPEMIQEAREIFQELVEINQSNMKEDTQSEEEPKKETQEPLEESPKVLEESQEEPQEEPQEVPQEPQEVQEVPQEEISEIEDKKESEKDVEK